VNANFSLPPEEIYVIRPVNFTSTSRNAATWDWVFEGATPAVSNDENPQVTFNSPGIYTVSLTVNKDSDAEITISKKVEVILKEKICPEEIIVGEEISSQTQFYPFGANQRQVLSSALYTAAEIGLEKAEKIGALSWFADSASAKPRKIYIYMKETAESSLGQNVTWANEIAGADLVYESPEDWTNPEGWITIPLQKAFKYSGTNNLKVMVRSLASDASGNNTFCHYSVSRGKHLCWNSESADLPTIRGSRNGNRPNIKFRADILCGVDSPVADFLTGAFSIDEPAEYMTFDKIPFTDRSTGPAVNWEWSFPGGFPESSQEENPSVSYAKAGTYTVTLKISNHLGNDTQERTLLIHPLAPLAAFSSSSEGFTTFPDYGPFLPHSGGTVSLRDESLYDPVGWEWTLQGIESTIPETGDITVNYPEGENVYSVRLRVSNAVGEDTKEMDAYVKVGGTAPVWNIPYGDKGDTCYLLSEGNYLTGSNTTYGILAEKFTAQAGGLITQVDLMLKVFNSTSLNSRNYTVSVYDENEGMPGTVLSSTVFRGSDINLSGYTRAIFPEPVAVTGNFYIEIKGIGTINTKVAIASSITSNPTVYVYKDRLWLPLEEYDPEKRKVSLNIVPVFTYETPFAVSSPSSSAEIQLYPNPVGDYLHVRSESPVENVAVSDIQGRRILTVNSRNAGQTIRTSAWKKGIYIVKIQTQKDYYICKVVKK
jgi:PKD repeat protein